MCLTENWIERDFLLLGDFAGRHPLFGYVLFKYFTQNIDVLFGFSNFWNLFWRLAIVFTTNSNSTVWLMLTRRIWFHEIFYSNQKIQGNVEFTKFSSWQKFRESNVFTKEVTKQSISRNIFVVREFVFFSKLCTWCFPDFSIV